MTTLASAGLSKKDHKACIKAFKKFEKKRSDKNKKVLAEAKCLEQEEFSIELARIEAKSPGGDFYSSKFQYKKKDIIARLSAHLEEIQTEASAFDKLRGMEPKKSWLRQSSCKFQIAGVEKITDQIKDKWKITIQISDDLVNPFSNLSFKDKVLMNENFEDDHYARIFDKILKKAGAVFTQCVLRDVF